VDEFQQRALKSLKSRHMSGLRREAEQISETIGYVLRDLDAGRLPGPRAREVLACAQGLATRMQALETLGEATDIIEAEPDQ
jgi:hypothetical protein